MNKVVRMYSQGVFGEWISVDSVEIDADVARVVRATRHDHGQLMIGGMLWMYRTIDE